MDYKIIVTAAVETVGIIQVLKNFLPENFPKWLYAVLMCVLAPVFCAVVTYCPPVVSASIMTICVSQLGYEQILQTINKIVSKVAE